MAEKFDPKKIKRIKNFDGVQRIYPLINKKEFVRKLEHTDYQTLMSRVKNHTKLTETVEQRASAQEITELVAEIFYEMGVWLGYFQNDPHKKYKYVDVNDPSERAKDEIGEIK